MSLANHIDKHHSNQILETHCHITVETKVNHPNASDAHDSNLISASTACEAAHLRSWVDMDTKSQTLAVDVFP